MRQIGPYLRLARERVGLSQRELSLRTGITQAAISKIESPAKGKPYFESIAKIAEVLGLSMDQLAADCGLISERSHRGQKLDSAELEKAQEGAAKVASHIKAASTELSATIRSLNVAVRRTKR